MPSLETNRRVARQKGAAQRKKAWKSYDSGGSGSVPSVPLARRKSRAEQEVMLLETLSTLAEVVAKVAAKPKITVEAPAQAQRATKTVMEVDEDGLIVATYTIPVSPEEVATAVKRIETQDRAAALAEQKALGS